MGFYDVKIKRFACDFNTFRKITEKNGSFVKELSYTSNKSELKSGTLNINKIKITSINNKLKIFQNENILYYESDNKNGKIRVVDLYDNNAKVLSYIIYYSKFCNTDDNQLQLDGIVSLPYATETTILEKTLPERNYTIKIFEVNTNDTLKMIKVSNTLNNKSNEYPISVFNDGNKLGLKIRKKENIDSISIKYKDKNEAPTDIKRDYDSATIEERVLKNTDSSTNKIEIENFDNKSIVSLFDLSKDFSGNIYFVKNDKIMSQFSVTSTKDSSYKISNCVFDDLIIYNYNNNKFTNDEFTYLNYPLIESNKVNSNTINGYFLQETLPTLVINKANVNEQFDVFSLNPNLVLIKTAETSNNVTFALKIIDKNATENISTAIIINDKKVDVNLNVGTPPQQVIIDSLIDINPNMIKKNVVKTKENSNIHLLKMRWDQNGGSQGHGGYVPDSGPPPIKCQFGFEYGSGTSSKDVYNPSVDASNKFNGSYYSKDKGFWYTEHFNYDKIDLIELSNFDGRTAVRPTPEQLNDKRYFYFNMMDRGAAIRMIFEVKSDPNGINNQGVNLYDFVYYPIDLRDEPNFPILIEEGICRLRLEVVLDISLYRVIIENRYFNSLNEFTNFLVEPNRKYSLLIMVNNANNSLDFYMNYSLIASHQFRNNLNDGVCYTIASLGGFMQDSAFTQQEQILPGKYIYNLTYWNKKLSEQEINELQEFDKIKKNPLIELNTVNFLRNSTNNNRTLNKKLRYTLNSIENFLPYSDTLGEVLYGSASYDINKIGVNISEKYWHIGQRSGPWAIDLADLGKGRGNYVCDPDENINIKVMESGFSIKTNFKIVQDRKSGNIYDQEIEFFSFVTNNEAESDPSLDHNYYYAYSNIKIRQTSNQTFALLFNSLDNGISPSMSTVDDVIGSVYINQMTSLILVLNPEIDKFEIYLNYEKVKEYNIHRDWLSNKLLYGLGKGFTMDAQTSGTPESRYINTHVYNLSIFDCAVDNEQIETFKKSEFTRPIRDFNAPLIDINDKVFENRLAISKYPDGKRLPLTTKGIIYPEPFSDVFSTNGSKYWILDRSNGPNYSLLLDYEEYKKDFTIFTLETGFTIRMDFKMVDVQQGDYFDTSNAFRLLCFAITPEDAGSFNGLKIQCTDLNRDYISLSVGKESAYDPRHGKYGFADPVGSLSNIRKNTMTSIIIVVNPIIQKILVYQDYVQKVTLDLNIQELESFNILLKSRLFILGNSIGKGQYLPYAPHGETLNKIAQQLHRLTVWDYNLSDTEIQKLRN